jgi:hypothetical protein
MSDGLQWPWWPGCFALADRPSDDQVWRLETWWYAAQGPLLLFGWAIPEPAINATPDQWRERSVRKTGIGRSVRHLMLTTTYGKLTNVLDGLAHGMTLASASDVVGLPHPSRLGHANLGRVSISRNTPSSEGPPDYFAAPWRFLPSRHSWQRKLSSPVSEVPAMRAALVRIDKAGVLPDDDADARTLLEILDDETGLSFVPGANLVGRDLIRLGDLELLAFRNAPHRSPGIRVTAPDEYVEVVIDGDLIAANVELLVRCRQTHSGAILADAVKRLVPGPGPSRCLRFAYSPVGASGAMIEVWVEVPEIEQFRLIYEHDAAWIRGVGWRSVIADAQISLGSAWIEEWSGRRRDVKNRRIRAAAMQSVKRVIHSRKSFTGKTDEPWSIGEKNAAAIARHLRPAQSGALWIPRMSDPDSGGRMRLVEWFRETFGKENAPSELLVVDPYFDTSGLDVIARIETPGWRVTVITALPTKADKADVKKKELSEAYDKFLPMFSKVDLRIFTVREGRLHDRYILEFAGSESPRHGFNLSNSLCSATENYGLLITPIPGDVLGEVADAVAEMIDGMQPLLSRPVPSPRVTASPVNINAKTESVAASETRVLAAATSCGIDSFCKLLAEHAWLVAYTGRVIDYGLEAAPRWSAVPGMAKMLHVYLSNKVIDGGHGGDPLRLISLAQAAAHPFTKQQAGVDVWMRSDGRGGSDWALQLGLWLLFVIDPERFTHLLCDYCEQASHGALEVQLGHGRRIEAALGVIEVAFRHGVVDESLHEVIAHGLGSEQPLVRFLLGALLGQKRIGRIGKLENDGWSPKRVRTLLLHFGDPEERLLVVADWLTELRWAISSIFGGNLGKHELLHREFIEWMIEDWPDTIARPDLVEVVRRCDAPDIAGAHSHVLIDELLVPLNRLGKLSAVDLVSVWLDDFEERIRQTLENNRFFSVNTDSGITDVCSRLLGDGGRNFDYNAESDRMALSKRFSATLDHLEQVWRNAGWKLVAPFARTLHYRGWANARKARAWISGFAVLLALRPDVSMETRNRVVPWIVGREIEGMDGGDGDDPSEVFPWLARLLELHADKCGA